MRRLLTSALFALGASAPLVAQGVLVAPHAVVIDHRTRSTSITLYNPSSTPSEIRITTFFGFPVTDSTGDFQLTTPAEGSPRSAAEWIDAYPRRTMLGPLERQTVRLLARPPANLADGEYWSRIMITAKGGKVEVGTTDSLPAGIQVGLDLEVRTIIPLQYRKGAVTTGIAVETPRVTRLGDSLQIRARLVRQGNAAFVGTARGTLINDKDQVVASFSVPLAVYNDIDPRFNLGVGGLPAGRYRFKLALVPERTDLPPEQILPARPQDAQVAVTLP